MANPLQPKVSKCLEDDYDAYVVNVVSSSKGGDMDLLACVPRPKLSYHTTDCKCTMYPSTDCHCPPKAVERKGLFFGFEIKWKNDQPSELQKQKINACIDAGGRAYFIRSVEQLRDILDNDIPPTRYKLKSIGITL